MQNIKKILKRLNFWEKQDSKFNDAFKDFIEVIAPHEYSPIINTGCVNSFLEGLGLSKEINDYLTWYLYEASGMKLKATITFEGKEYDGKNDNEFCEFLKVAYPKTFK